MVMVVEFDDDGDENGWLMMDDVADSPPAISVSSPPLDFSSAPPGSTRSGAKTNKSKKKLNENITIPLKYFIFYYYVACASYDQ